MLNKEVTDAVIELKQAEQNFNYAEPKFIDIAIVQYNLAVAKLNVAIVKRKLCG